MFLEANKLINLKRKNQSGYFTRVDRDIHFFVLKNQDGPKKYNNPIITAQFTLSLKLADLFFEMSTTSQTFSTHDQNYVVIKHEQVNSLVGVIKKINQSWFEQLDYMTEVPDTVIDLLFEEPINEKMVAEISATI